MYPFWIDFGSLLVDFGRLWADLGRLGSTFGRLDSTFVRLSFLDTTFVAQATQVYIVLEG